MSGDRDDDPSNASLQAAAATILAAVRSFGPWWIPVAISALIAGVALAELLALFGRTREPGDWWTAVASLGTVFGTTVAALALRSLSRSVLAQVDQLKISRDQLDLERNRAEPLLVEVRVQFLLTGAGSDPIDKLRVEFTNFGGRARDVQVHIEGFVSGLGKGDRRHLPRQGELMLESGQRFGELEMSLFRRWAQPKIDGLTSERKAEIERLIAGQAKWIPIENCSEPLPRMSISYINKSGEQVVDHFSLRFEGNAGPVGYGQYARGVLVSRSLYRPIRVATGIFQGDAFDGHPLPPPDVRQ